MFQNYVASLNKDLISLQGSKCSNQIPLIISLQYFGYDYTCNNFSTTLISYNVHEAVAKVHEEIIRSGFHSEVFVGNALLYMYAKYGKINTARYVFDKFLRRDVVKWNAMIAGYAQKGYVNEVLDRFDKIPE